MEISESNRQINVFVPHEHVGYDLNQEPVIRWKDESKEGDIIKASLDVLWSNSFHANMDASDGSESVFLDVPSELILGATESFEQ
jgi:hypothetical protein